MVDVEKQGVMGEFQTYVKPVTNPQLTAFCTELTGITQDDVDSGVGLKEGLDLHQSFLQEQGYTSENGVFVTCGDWDLKTCLPKDLRAKRITAPSSVYGSWINIKFAFHSFYGFRPKGMVGMLEHLSLELEGRHHSGIDDCKNIARIALKMLEDGWKP